MPTDRPALLSGFELFVPPKRGNSRGERIGLSVSRNRKVMMISLATYSALGQPENVVLFRDSDGSRIAIQRTDATDRNAYPVNPKTHKWTGSAFIEWAGLQPGFYSGTVEGDMLICAIPKEGTTDAN